MLRGLVAAPLVLLAACGPADHDEPADEGAVASEADALEPAVGQACNGRRWVGESIAGVCPAGTPQWVGGPMFNGAPQGLASFCLYEWAGAGTPGAAAFANLPIDAGRAGLSWLRRDCHVSAPLGSSPPLNRDDLAMRFDREAGALPWLPSAPPRQVLVAVLDASPDSVEGVPVGRIGHGHAVGSIIHDLTCPWGNQGACATREISTLALPLTKPDVRDWSTGGTFGSQADVAQAIFRTLNVAQGQVDQQGPLPLIINLSLGWDPRWTDLASSPVGVNVPGPVESVRRALEFASCRGAVVFAAAGNNPNGTALATGPMLPAAWESTNAPSYADCQSRYGSFPGQVDPHRPLVYAVGGLAGGANIGTPIPNARAGARPRLNAPGKFATGKGYDPATNMNMGTDMLTGTSASTAVVSAAAALVWAYHPDWPGSTVVEQLAAASDPIGLGADFGLDGPGAPARRVEICRALERNWVAGVGCGPAAWESAEPPQSSLLPGLVASTYAGVSTTVLPTYKTRIVSSCAKRKVSSDGKETSTESVCPDLKMPNAVPMPWAGPQPNEPPCPSCLARLRPWDLRTDAYLKFEGPDGATISAPTLVYTTSTGAVGSVALGRTGTTLAIGTQYIFSAPTPADVVSASVVVRVTTGSLLTTTTRRSATIVLPVYQW